MNVCIVYTHAVRCLYYAHKLEKHPNENRTQIHPLAFAYLQMLRANTCICICALYSFECFTSLCAVQSPYRVQFVLCVRKSNSLFVNVSATFRKSAVVHVSIMYMCERERERVFVTSPVKSERYSSALSMRSPQVI